MTTTNQQDRDSALAQLREMFPPGSTVPVVLRHVSRSGMSRSISVLSPDARDVSFLAARVLPYKFDRKNDGLKIGGCGMDMGFAIVYELSATLWPQYPCLGKSDDVRCPSNYHSNHRDMIRCEGHGGRFCWAP